MTDVLVRLPDQFRPSHDRPMAATPTCCCCCCCCFATLITASIVLPMRVELLARQAPPVAHDRITRSKAMARLAPLASLVLAIALGSSVETVFAFLVVLFLVMVGMLAAAYAPFGVAVRAVPVAVVFVVAFVVEVVVGAFGILVTAGIGYVVLGALAAVGVVRLHQRRLAEGQSMPGRVENGPPPPLPRPPSSGEPA